MPINTERAKIIREATLKAVAERNKLIHTSVDDLVHTYNQASDAITEHIQKAADQDDRITLNSLQELLSEVRKQLRGAGRSARPAAFPPVKRSRSHWRAPV
ncbi:hypothetical protein [Paludibacterium denitrificans]|uniref:Uncharacterized protein n=1 Tax=Paludibacterium denitrificans TaxID=2675226 RepID=A0A844GC98_9NEIS|nr:hypothetical protein [Paludibacterium denitrificans]MTD32394.1 hypothetical protein [Paludibacterium denitrificans]